MKKRVIEKVVMSFMVFWMVLQIIIGRDITVKAEEREKKITNIDEMYQKVYTDVNIQSKGLNYRLYIPSDYTENQKEGIPLLIYLNGAGSRGTDNSSQLKNLSPLITPFIENENYPDCIIVVPQLSNNDRWVNVDWAAGCYDASVPESNSSKLLIGLINELKRNYKVDTDRVYLMGQSFGGYGTWDLISRYPEVFAAAVPMCGAGCIERAEAIVDMPLLVLHGNDDSIVPVSGSREMVEAVKNAGSRSVTYIEYEGDDHYIQRRLFEQPELYIDWLFAQEKGKPPIAPDVSRCYMPRLTMNMNSKVQLDKLTMNGGTAVINEEQMKIIPSANNTSVLALINNTEKLEDGVLSAHFTIEALKGTGGAGLVLRAQNNNTYIHVRFTTEGVNLLERV